MEPMLISESSRFRNGLADFAVEIAARSAGFKRSLPGGIDAALADLVRSMNCYYSNLIEGHDTHPIDIERALKNDYSKDVGKRSLQLEAKAHIEVQRWIDEGAIRGRAATAAAVCEIHRRFCRKVPDELLWVRNPETGKKIKVVPGQLRKRDVRVGRHIPIGPGAVPRFLERFEDVYGHLGKAEAILATAAAHHRLVWIHPFIDGNGRVARLMSHAVLLETLDTGAIWSVARGFARNVEECKRKLANCDLERRNDLDGRGHLSEAALAQFTRFFLDTCQDQISFMEGLVDPERLKTRIVIWAEEEIRLRTLPTKAGNVLEALLYRGELQRGEVGNILGTTARHARRIVAALTARNVLVSEGPRAPLRRAFPAAVASRWMPGLFPEKKGP
ncbi:MAG: Fic family protein [Deltaproteobacteria bacterium]|nr:Fic family protein [Deltaproteobacteria bacterium]